MNKTRVLIVEDSLTVRERLRSVVEGSDAFQVVAVASDGREAIRLCEMLRPDVVTMDMMLPRMDGLQATKYIMANVPTPILVVSSSFNRGEVFRTYDALTAGAVDVMEKPSGDEQEGVWEKNLLSSLRVVSRVRVITRRPRRDPPVYPAPDMLPDRRERVALQAVAIGVSTGGPAALVEVLGRLTPAFPLPVLVVMHLSAEFAPSFVDWFNTQTACDVAYAQGGERLDRLGGKVVFAPAKQHMVVVNGRVQLSDAPQRHSCKPSVDVLFESLAKSPSPHALGCLLTGMGRDGAEGLLSMRRAGCRTIAQDEQSCVVYGMPREAALLGAAEQVLSLQAVAQVLVDIEKVPR